MASMLHASTVRIGVLVGLAGVGFVVAQPESGPRIGMPMRVTNLPRVDQDAMRARVQDPPVQTSRTTGAQIGLNFVGSDIFQAGFIPPDTMGAPGLDHYVELINGRYAVYDKSTGALVQSSSLDDFWLDAGVALTNFTFDPRVIFDADSGRWFAAAVTNAGRPSSAFLVAVSNSDDPTVGWTGFSVDADSDDEQWADFPTMGVDADGMYVSGNMFPTGSAGFMINVLVIPKADLAQAVPTVANATLIEDLDFGDVGFALQPAVNPEGLGNPTPILAEFDTGSGVVRRTSIVGPITSPSVDVSAPFVTVPAASSPPLADQPPSPSQKDPLDSGGTRIRSCVPFVDGNLWAVQGVESNGRPALRWLRIDEATSTLAESGVLTAPNLGFIYGSIAVNIDGDVVVGATGVGPDQAASCYAFTGHFDGTSTAFDAPLLLRAGVDDYERTDGVGRNRWGDYSSTMVDPTDPKRFWTIQEFVIDNDVWATNITEIVFPGGQICRADLNNDDDLDFFDVSLFLTLFGNDDLTVDFNNDGVLNFFDVSTFLAEFTAGCP